MLWASVRARMCACTWMPATYFFVGMSCFFFFFFFFFFFRCLCAYAACKFFFNNFKEKSLSWVHVCLCAQACVPGIFFRGRCFWRMHVYACSHDMHILYGCVHTRGTTMLHTIAPHTCARWASFERQTYFSNFNFVFFMIFIWFGLLLDLFIHEVLLAYSLSSMLLLLFLQLHTKIRASHYLVNIMEEVQFVSSNIEKAFEQSLRMWSDVGGTQHETIYLLIIKWIYFMNSYLECTVLVFFFLIKSENSLMHGLFHNCSFMHKLLIISCTGTCPVCAVNMSVHLMTAFPLKLSVTNSWTACRFLAWIYSWYYEQ